MVMTRMLTTRSSRNFVAFALIRSMFVSLIFAVLTSSIVFGQGGVATGDLHITVKDPNGSFVANAKVTVSDAAKGLERTAT